MLVNFLHNKFKQIPKQQHNYVDEQMIPYKRKTSLKQYTQANPPKWDFKFFVLADNKGVMHDFMPYTGKIDPVYDNDVPDLRASSNIVLHKAQCIPSQHNHLLFLNNWLTSLEFLTHLASCEIWCCGAIRPQRVTGLSKEKEK